MLGWMVGARGVYPTSFTTPPWPYTPQLLDTPIVYLLKGYILHTTSTPYLLCTSTSVGYPYTGNTVHLCQLYTWYLSHAWSLAGFYLFIWLYRVLVSALRIIHRGTRTL